MSIYEEMRDAGLVLGNHCSDLHVKDSPEAWAIIEKHKSSLCRATRFISNIAGEGLCIELAFAYDPYWDKMPGTHSLSAA